MPTHLTVLAKVWHFLRIRCHIELFTVLRFARPRAAPIGKAWRFLRNWAIELLTVLEFSLLRAASIYQSVLQEFMKPCSLQNLAA